MNQIYDFVSGPLAWVAWLIFIGGVVFKLYQTYNLAKTRDRTVLDYFSLKYALRSIMHWSIPFGSVNMRLKPVMTVVTFAFHLCLIIAPIFLTAHVVLWDTSFGFSFPAIPDHIADIMTVIVLLCCGYFLYRRLAVPEVQYVTSASDFVLLAIVAAPFLFGFLAYHQIFDYKLMVTLHVLTGEIMLASIPFTRLVHMVMAPLTRGYIGSEFGGVRHARDW